MTEATCTSLKSKLSKEVLGIYEYRGLPFHLLCFSGLVSRMVESARLQQELEGLQLLSNHIQVEATILVIYGKLEFFNGDISYKSKISSPGSKISVVAKDEEKAELYKRSHATTKKALIYYKAKQITRRSRKGRLSES